MGKVGDIVGPKKLYMVGLSIFGITSLVLGFTNDVTLIIIFRALQGVGTAILYTMPMAIIAHLWKDRAKAFAVTASFFAFGMLIGPMVGGILAQLTIFGIQGWHFLFLLNIPFVVLSAIISAIFIPKLEIKKKSSLNFVSLVLLLSGLGIIVLSLSIINNLFILLGLALLVLLYYYEKFTQKHLLDFPLFKNTNFSFANSVSFFSMVTVVGMGYVLTFYFQDVLRWSSFTAGLAFMPVPIATGIAAALSGKIKKPKLGAVLSSGLTLLGILILTFASPSTPYYMVVLPGIVFLAAGSGVLMTTIFATIFDSTPTEKSGNASGILNTIQQLGALIGIAIVASYVLDYKMSFIILSTAAILGFVSALFVKNVQKSRLVAKM